MKNVNTLFLAYGLLVAIMVIALISKLIYGIDITDEGYYIVSVANPFEYPETTSYFGFVLHPLYKLLNSDITLLRIVFWSSLYLISVFLFYSIITLDKYQVSNIDQINLSYRSSIVISAALAFSVFSNFQFWLPTPNYNSLTLYAVVVFALGITLFAKGKERSVVCSGLLVGLSGAIAFLAKPTTAAALALVYAIFIISLVYKVRCQKLFISIGIAVLTSIAVIIVFAFYSSGSIEAYINNLQQGMKFGELLLGKKFSSIKSLLWRGTGGGFHLIIDNVIFILLASFLLGWWAYNSERKLNLKKSDKKYEIITGFSLVFFVGLFLYSIYAFFYSNPFIYISSYRLDRIIILWGPLLFITAFIGFLRLLKKQINLSKVILACCLLILPYCYTFGTNNNYFTIVTFASVFIPAAVAVCANQSRRREWLVCLSLYVISTTILVIPPVTGGMYRQPNALRSAPDTLATIDQGPLKNIVVVNYIKKYFDFLRDKAEGAGFKPGTPVLDLTGASSGTIFAIGGKNVASAWMIGGYGGSHYAAKFRLAAVDPEEIKQSWILTEDWSRKINASILTDFGLDFETDYEYVGEVIIPGPLGGRGTSQPQKLYKPRNN